MTNSYVHIGGVVAAGFDASGEYLLVISHSGRGVYSTKSWERLARDYDLAYPEQGFGTGIGPIKGLAIPVTETDYEVGEFSLSSPDGRIRLNCASEGIEVLTNT